MIAKSEKYKEWLIDRVFSNIKMDHPNITRDMVKKQVNKYCIVGPKGSIKRVTA
jgi:hypothetical protein